MITIPLNIPNGTISKSTILGSTPPTNSILSTWLSLRVLTIRVWSLWSTQKRMLSQVRVRVLDGIEMVKIYATSKIHWKKRPEDSTTHSLSRCNSQMIMMKYTYLIVIHIHIQIALSCSKNCASQNLKTG